MFCLFLVGPLGGIDYHLKEAEEGSVFTEQVLLIRSCTGNFWFADVSLQREKSGIIENSGSKTSQIIESYYECH